MHAPCWASLEQASVQLVVSARWLMTRLTWPGAAVDHRWTTSVYGYEPEPEHEPEPGLGLGLELELELEPGREPGPGLELELELELAPGPERFAYAVVVAAEPGRIAPLVAAQRTGESLLGLAPS